MESAGETFIDTVCPTRVALDNLLATAISAGGWREMLAEDARQYAQEAVAQTQATVRGLDEAAWPDPLTATIPGVVDEYLATLRPLERLASANPKDRAAAWRDLQSLSRSHEEKVRISLGLGSYDSTDNGCPLPPNVKPQPQESNAKTEEPSSQSDSSAWTMHWTSPSGNIACGYAPKGSDGRPVVACIVLDEGTLMRVRSSGIVEGPVRADGSDQSQLTSASANTLGWGQTIAPPGFFCQQSTQSGSGMACQENTFGQGFTIKRGTYWPYAIFN